MTLKGRVRVSRVEDPARTGVIIGKGGPPDGYPDPNHCAWMVKWDDGRPSTWNAEVGLRKVAEA